MIYFIDTERYPVGDYLGVTKRRQTSAQSITLNTWTDVTWHVTDYDNLGAVSSSTQFTVPTGVTMMRVGIKYAWANRTTTNEERRVRFWDGTVCYAGDDQRGMNEGMHGGSSGWVPVTAGTVLEMEAWTDGTLNLGDSSAYAGFCEITIEWASGFTGLHA